MAGKNFTGTAQFNDVVEFYCDDGYELTGPLRSICNTGVWTHEGTLPSCVGKITQYLLSWAYSKYKPAFIGIWLLFIHKLIGSNDWC